MQAFIESLPKVELHLHIEGTLEPELMFGLARRNGVDIPFDSPDAVRAAYRFTDLQSFLDIYYQGAKVLLHERDFFDLTWAYLERCRRDRVRHTEIFFDPQTHTERGIAFATVIDGIDRALGRAETELGISSRLIMCFLRHLDEAAAEATLDQALPYRERIAAVGLDSGEKGNPPDKFERVFARARAEGFLAVAHAGEEGPPAYIRDALDKLGVARIDHGVRCVEDPALVERLAAERVPLTICPLSNVKLCVFERIEDHNIVELLRRGLCVTINSDDPAYFGGYMNDNFNAVAEAFTLQPAEIAQFSYNAIEASFLDDAAKQALRGEIDAALAAHSAS